MNRIRTEPIYQPRPKSRPKNLINILIVFLLVLAFGNVVIANNLNLHVHKDIYGNLVLHSHYQNHAQDHENPDQSHSHTNSDFYHIYTINHLLKNFIFFAFNFAQLILILFLIKLIFKSKPINVHALAFQSRAPPVLSL